MRPNLRPPSNDEAEFETPWPSPTDRGTRERRLSRRVGDRGSGPRLKKGLIVVHPLVNLPPGGSAFGRPLHVEPDGHAMATFVDRRVPPQAQAGSRQPTKSPRELGPEGAPLGASRLAALYRHPSAFQGHLDKGVLAFHVLLLAAHRLGVPHKGRSPLTFHEIEDEAA